MNYLIILNTLAIVYILIFKDAKYYFTFRKNETFINKTLLGYHLTLWRKTSYGATGIFSYYFPIRNRHKVETREEVERMINSYSQQNKLQSLSAKFSWLKTWKEVKQFEKDYLVVDRKIVENLVSNFKENEK
jgi:hypothetical protein